jgi:hypothetical protein
VSKLRLGQQVRKGHGGIREQAITGTSPRNSAKGALMQELRLVAVSEDGSYAVLVVPGRSGRFALPIDERLRTVARGQFSRLAQYEIEVESPLRPKEIQDRIRAGETAEEIADAAGLPVDRIRRFEGPVLAEREFRAAEAQRATVRAPGEAGPGQRLGDVVGQRLVSLGASAEDQEWDSRKRQDGNWQVQLAYTVAGRMYVAEWVYDPKSKHVTPVDDEAVRLSLDESHWPSPRSQGQAVKATVTPIASRLAGGSHPSETRGDSDRRALQHPSRAGSAGAAGAPSMPGAQPGAQPAPAQTAPARPAAAVAQAEQAQAVHLRSGPPPADARAAGTVQAGTAQAGTAQASTAQASTVQASTVQASTVPEDAARAGSERQVPEPAGAARAAQAPAAGGSHAAGTGPQAQEMGQPAADAAEPAPPAADQPAADPHSPESRAPEPEREAQQPARPARRTSGRSRRSSVPSWDEIMFGTSRQPE